MTLRVFNDYALLMRHSYAISEPKKWLHEVLEGCAFSTPLVEHVGVSLSVARGFHDADGAVEPCKLLRHRHEGHGARQLHSCARGFARIAEFPDHRIAVSHSHDPLRGARCYAGGPHKIAHSCHIGGLDAFGLSKAGNLPVTLYSVSTPSGPTDFMANPAGVIFSSNSFSPMAKIFTCFADCDCALSIYRLASARAKKGRLTYAEVSILDIPCLSTF